MRKADIDKISALETAACGMGQTAAEMHMKPDSVEKAASDGGSKGRQEEASTTSKQGMKEFYKKASAKNGRNQEEKQKEISITPERLKEIYEKAAAIGAREALKAFEQERKKEYSGRADRRLRNTKLLLRNYHMLKEHAQNSVFGRTQMEESALDILESMMSMYDNEVIIESIKRSATRTAIMVSHIETMFGLYAAYCEKSPNRDIEMRRYAVAWDMYMAEDTLSAKEIADKQHMTKDNVYADLRVATERLTALIFGVDGLKVR